MPITRGQMYQQIKTGTKKNIVDAKDDKASKSSETKKPTDTSQSSSTEK